MTTPNLFGMIKTFFEADLFGSIVLLALFIIFILGIMILAARVSFKIALVLLFPALLALFGIGIDQGLLGHNYKWIIILIMVALSIGTYAFIWFKLAGD